MSYVVKVSHVCVVLHKGRKLELAVGIGVGCRGNVPDLGLAAEAHGEVAAGGREGQSGNGRSEREVVYGNLPGNVCENCLAILIDGEEEVATGSESDATYVLAMGEGERVGLVSEAQESGYV